jgi:hypothetical protein
MRKTLPTLSSSEFLKIGSRYAAMVSERRAGLSGLEQIPICLAISKNGGTALLAFLRAAIANPPPKHLIEKVRF